VAPKSLDLGSVVLVAAALPPTPASGTLCRTRSQGCVMAGFIQIIEIQTSRIDDVVPPGPRGG
jgi:hypothetical protein